MLHVVRPAKFLALYEEAIKRVTREIDAGEYPEWMLDAHEGDVSVVVMAPSEGIAHAMLTSAEKI